MVGITRVGAIKNMDTDEELPINSPRNMNRSMLHRILKKHNINHDVNWGFETLVNLIVMNDIPFLPIPPGEMEAKEEIVESNDTQSMQEQIDQLTRQLKNLTQPVAEAKPEPKKKEKEVVMMADGFPKSVFVVRKWCRDRNIPTNNTDTRKALIDRLKKYAENPSEYL